MENSCEESIPLAYLNNQNPYAYCAGYCKNSINMPERKSRLAALQRIQPTKISFRMPLKHVEREKEHLISHAVEAQRKELIRKGLMLLGSEYHDNPEYLFEQNFHVERILDIAIQLKKLNLFHHQKHLRSKVAAALAPKVSEDIEYSLSTKKTLELDNLKDALVYCKLQDLYGRNDAK